jgi:alpha-tubulin suppressor-like RCC1 family protein
MMARRGVVLVGALFALAACGDDDAGMDDGGTDSAIGTDTGPECTADPDCDDGLFCNGAEACVAGACVAGSAIACDDSIECTLDVCDEDLDRCVFAAPDADGDGVRDASCVDGEGMPLGADCDDDDANRFPGNPEVCDVDGHDEDCNLETFGAIDRDGDGYFDARCCNPTEDGTGQTCGLDCDDVRPNVSPAATEACDRVDNDCDGDIDEEVRVAGYVDADRDGFGDFSMPLDSCPGLAGFVPAGGDEDCDDDDRTRNPGQVEICDDVDNDCDETVDESPQVVDWFRDVDGDGFGNAAGGIVRSCTPIAGHSLFGTDCNDAVAGVNPAAAETCNGRDDDCVGGADFEIAPGDFEDDDGDGVADVGCGLPRGIDCDDLDPITAGGSAEACDGRDNDCDGNVDEGAMDTLWYFDGDLDGHGSPANPTRPVLRACRPQPGYVASGGDCDDADPARNPDEAETCNARDDDCDGSIDERNVCGCAPGLGDCNDDDVCETNTGADRNNCGACGNVCTAGPNARGVSCVAGACTSTGCRLGYEDCDGNAANGCETNVFVDTANCGACGEVCAAPPGTNVDSMRCDGLECDIASCAPGFEDCDGNPSNGCETRIANDPDNCGSCGVACGFGPGGVPIACSSGACNQPCVLGSTADCDGDPLNGCETNLGTPEHCNDCGDTCGVGGSCTSLAAGGFVCQVSCAPNTADCDGNPGNGCEAPVSYTSCGCGPTIDCTVANGPASIGTCRGFAPGSAQCERTGCLPGAVDCFGRCVDLDVDPDNCGTCGVSCGGFACNSGMCDCGTRSFCFGVGCVDTDTDPRNCGACGNDCGAGPCVGGTCQLACGPGTADCDLDPFNGCEVGLQTDSANCGQCGRRCPSPTEPLDHVSTGGCSVGNCVYTCAPGWGDCDRAPDSGCEIPITNDPFNCGGCGRACGAGGRCNLSTCDRVSKLAVGEEHTCALRSGPSIVCWGANSFGQLGLPGVPATNVPDLETLVPGFPFDVAVGRYHTCALTDEAGAPRVYCWGHNSNGQVGNGMTGGNVTSPAAVTLPGGFIPVELALGDLHSCVWGETTSGPEVYCWGRGASGELGNGMNPTAQNMPVRVETGPGEALRVGPIRAGGSFTCGPPATPNATIELQCWGANDQGQLGRGTVSAGANRPGATQPFGNGFQPTQIALGRDHACVANGPDLFCWGDNGLSQFDGSGTDRSSPGMTPRPSGTLQSVSAGLDRTCLQFADGVVRCRGDNSSSSGAGALVPGPSTVLTTWERVFELGSATQSLFFGSSAVHQCAQTSAGQVYCWGENQGGRLGIGPIFGNQPPTLVGALTP